MVLLNKKLGSVYHPMSLLLASSAFHELYSGTDFSSLSWLEQQWAAWYTWVWNPVVATGVLAVVVHEVSF